MRPVDFTPAEALYLLCGEKIALRSLLKATVLDLIRREVLQVSLEPHTEDFHLAKVCAGPKIGDFQPLPFEAPFVARFRQVPDWKPDLKLYVMDLERKPYASVVKFMAAVHRDSRIKPYIITHFFRTLIGGYRANRAGENMAHEIRRLLTEGLDLLARRPRQRGAGTVGRTRGTDGFAGGISVDPGAACGHGAGTYPEPCGHADTCLGRAAGHHRRRYGAIFRRYIRPV